MVTEGGSDGKQLSFLPQDEDTASNQSHSGLFFSARMSDSKQNLCWFTGGGSTTAVSSSGISWLLGTAPLEHTPSSSFSAMLPHATWVLYGALYGNFRKKNSKSQDVASVGGCSGGSGGSPTVSPDEDAREPWRKMPRRGTAAHPSGPGGAREGRVRSEEHARTKADRKGVAVYDMARVHPTWPHATRPGHKAKQ